MSGKLFQLGEHPTTPIKSEVAPLLQQLIIKELLDVYPELEYCCIGSVGKKKDGDYNGDIDISIKAENVDELESIIKNVFSYTESVTSKSYYIVSIKYPYKDILDDNKLKFAAVDFMVMKDKDYTQFRYYCPDYRKDESKYKVGAKIMWVNTILNHCPERLCGVDINNHQMGSFRFNPDGLNQTIFDTETFNVISSKFVTTDVDKIVNMVFNDGDRSHFNSVEMLWDAIHSKHYKYPEEVRTLEMRLMINSYRKSWEQTVDPRDFTYKYWTVDEIMDECKKYDFEKSINKYLNEEQQ